MIPEVPLEQTEHGLVSKGDGWFVRNARDARWAHANGRGAVSLRVLHHIDHGAVGITHEEASYLPRLVR